MGEKKPTVSAIDKSSPHFESVISLWRENAAQLGFFPKGAFEAHAEKKQILVSLRDGQLAGYLLYRVSRDRASIVHLCISPKFRGTGITKCLFEELDRITADLQGIGLWCRRDYSHATALWERLGFKPRSDKPSRGKDGSHLTFWWYDHNLPTLFSDLKTEPPPGQFAVAIDTNIFFELIESSTSHTEDSHYLAADWLRDEISLTVTPEIHIEIHRHENPQTKKWYREALSGFNESTGTTPAFSTNLKALNAVLPPTKNERDNSDRHHLAHCAAAAIDTFITKDAELLAAHDKISKAIGVSVIDPATFIIQIDERHHPTEYQPYRLAGTSIRSARLSSSEILEFGRVLQSSRLETRKQFTSFIKKLALKKLCDVHTIRNGGSICGGYAFSRSEELVLEIPLLRFADDRLSSTLARHLISRATLHAARDGRRYVLVSDPGISAGTEAALRKESFVRHSNGWAKATLLGINSTPTISALVRHPHFKGLEISTSELNKSLHDSAYALAVEKQLWPVKVSGAKLPCFIIPIRPGWAERLFDENLANETFLGDDTSLTLNCESVYYRSGRRCLSAPGRILWHVSKGERFSNTSTIRAASLLSSIEIDEATLLFRRNSRLGVYGWPDVLKTAEGDAHRDIMAVHFSNTECLRNPVAFPTAASVLKKYGIRSTFISPTPIPEKAFFELYELAAG